MHNKGLGEILVEAGILSEDQLKEALEKQALLKSPKRLGDLLVSLGYITERDRIMALGRQWGVRFIDLTEHKCQDDAVALLSLEVASRYKAIPVRRDAHKLVLAMKNPLDIFAIDEVRLITGLEVEPVIATEEDIRNAINSWYHNKGTVTAALSEVIRDMDDSAVTIQQALDAEDDLSLDQLKELSSEAPIVRLANMIITRAVHDKASDIHIEPRKGNVVVRYRVDGILHDAMEIPKKVQYSLISRIKIMAEMDIAEKRAPQDGRISATIDGREFDFRVNSLPGVHGEKIVLRILDKGSIRVGLEKLGFNPDVLKVFEDCISRTHGIFLVTGPTGSGKSTTLYSSLSRINTGDTNIITLEDPVEYEIEGITQCNINVRAGMTFANGLRAILRQDPDIVMVGEIRDKETAVIAIEAALTGHLVLSTLHTNDAPSAVSRLVDMDVEPFLISSALTGALAQRLVRRLCGKCKEAYQPPPEAIRRIGFNEETDGPITFYKGLGCDACKKSGYLGRMGIYELMVVNDEIRELTLKKASAHQIKQAAIAAGMRTLKDDALEKIAMGLTSPEEALRVIFAG